MPVGELVVETRGPLLRYVDVLGTTWFSHIDVPGVLGVRRDDVSGHASHHVSVRRGDIERPSERRN